MRKQTRKSTNRVLSLILSVAMLLGMISVPQIGFADASGAYDKTTLTEDSPIRADISYEYMGTTGDLEMITALPDESIDDFTWKAGDYVWVGVYTANLSRQTQMFQSGLKNMTLAMLYDSNYFEWDENSLYSVFGWLGYPTVRVAARDQDCYAPTGYAAFTLESEKANASQFATYSDRHLTNTNDSQLMIAQQEIVETSYASNANAVRMFEGSYFKDEKQLIAVFPLKMKSTELTDGTKAIEGLFNTVRFIMVFDDGGSFRYVNNRSEDEATNLHNRLNFVESVVNLKPATYTVTYDKNNSDASLKTGVTAITEKVKENSTLTFTDETTGSIAETLIDPPEGYVFKEWTTDAAGTDSIDNTVAINTTNVPTIDTANSTLTLYAQYKQGYQVNFHANGGTLDAAGTTDKSLLAGLGEYVLGASETLKDDHDIDPQRSGHSFEGWYMMENGTFTTKVEESDLRTTAYDKTIDLYAKWNFDPTATNELTFDKNDGDTEANPNYIKYNNGESLNDVIGGMPSEPTRSGYRFEGWYLTPSGDGAKLTPSVDLATYLNVGGTVKDTVYARWTYMAPPSPSGMPDDPNIEVDDDPSPSPNPDTVTVKFNRDGDGTYNGGTYAYPPINNKYVKIETAMTNMPNNADLTRPGYGFGGWFTEPNGAGYEVKDGTVIGAAIGATAGGEITLYAHWLDNIDITYDLNGLDQESPSVSYTDPTDHTNVSPGASFTPEDLAITTPDYTFVEWNTAADGSGTSYMPGVAATVPNTDTTLYAIWNYTGPDAIDVVFHGNGTATYEAVLTPPSDATTTSDTHTISRKPGSKIVFANMPVATRNQYKFNHWADVPNDPEVNPTPDNSTYEITLPAIGPDTVDQYAIWESDPTNPDDKITVSFFDSADGTTKVQPDVTVTRGDSLGGAMPANPTKTGFGFNGWTENQGGTGVAIDSDTTFGAASGTNNIVIAAGTTTASAYAQWSPTITITFDMNKGTPVDTTLTSIDPVTVVAGEKVSTVVANLTALDVKRDSFTFVGWYYEDPDNAGDYKQLTGDDTFTADITVTAKWSVSVSISIDDPDLEYNGSPQTPFYAGNYQITVTSSGNDITSDVPLSDFVIEYTSKNDGGAAYPKTTAEPTDVNQYLISVAPADNPYLLLEIRVNDVTHDFNITPAAVDYNWKNLEQIGPYGTSFNDDLVEKDPGAPAGVVVDPFNKLGNNSTDVIIKVTDADGNDSYAAPTDYGTYTLTLEAAAGSNYSIASGVTTATLYYYPNTREVHIDYTGQDATAPNGTGITSNPYTTVTIPFDPANGDTPATVKQDIEHGGAPNTTMPVEGTDYTAPTGYVLDKWVICPTSTYDAANATDFDANSELYLSGDPAYVFAIYKKAEWTLTFNDEVAPTTSTYAIESEKSIAEGGVKEIDSLVPSPIPTDLPVGTATVANKVFVGWTLDQTFSQRTDLAEKDFVAEDTANGTPAGQYFDKLITSAAKPGSEGIDADATAVDVYAVYALSSDATLDTDPTTNEPNTIFKEVDSSDVVGVTIPYVENDYVTPATFTPEQREYYLVASNDAEKTYVEIITSNAGSTVTISKDGTNYENTTDPTDKTAKIPLDVASNGSTNDIIVVVTSPDGSTTETYTFHILRKAVPTMTMNYGNSPAGLIMRDNSPNFDTLAKKEAAIEAFNASHTENKQYADGLVPNHGSADMIYTASAWLSYNDGRQIEDDDYENWDLNPYTLFAYIGSTFKDPGFIVTDEFGRTVSVDSNDVTVNMTFKKQRSAGSVNYTSDAAYDDHTPDLVAGETDEYTLEALMIRPDKYDMVYSYTLVLADGTSQPLTQTRPICVISRKGDVYLTTTVGVSGEDVTELKNKWNVINGGNSLFAFRHADVKFSTTAGVSGEDVTELKNNWNIINGVGYGQYYDGEYYK